MNHKRALVCYLIVIQKSMRGHIGVIDAAKNGYQLLIETFPEVKIYRRMPEATKLLLLADIRAIQKGETVKQKRREKQGIVPPLVESLFKLEIKMIRGKHYETYFG